MSHKLAAEETKKLCFLISELFVLNKVNNIIAVSALMSYLITMLKEDGVPAKQLESWVNLLPGNFIRVKHDD